MIFKICFHKWSTWSELTAYKYDDTAQYRVCQKCGLIGSRRVNGVPRYIGEAVIRALKGVSHLWDDKKGKP